MSKKKQDEVKAGAPAWMASYSDMMSLLLCFFVLLYAMAESDIDGEALAAILAAFGNPNFAPQIAVVQPSTSPGLDVMFGSGIINMPIPATGHQPGQGTIQVDDIDIQIAMRSMILDFETYFLESENSLAQEVEVTVFEDSVMLTFLSDMLFASGSDLLTAQTLGVLDYVASVLAEYPMFTINVHGHTDNVPINTARFQDNRWLGYGRAHSVMSHFHYIHGIDRHRIRTESFGEDRPIGPNYTVEGRALNRRVEILIAAE